MDVAYAPLKQRKLPSRPACCRPSQPKWRCPGDRLPPDL